MSVPPTATLGLLRHHHALVATGTKVAATQVAAAAQTTAIGPFGLRSRAQVRTHATRRDYIPIYVKLHCAIVISSA